MVGGGSPGSTRPLPTIIVHFLIQVKPPTNVKSDDAVSPCSRRKRVSDPQPAALFNAKRYADLKTEHHSFPKLRLRAGSR
jgi:hypothetical protein